MHFYKICRRKKYQEFGQKYAVNKQGSIIGTANTNTFCNKINFLTDNLLAGENKES